MNEECKHDNCESIAEFEDQSYSARYNKKPGKRWGSSHQLMYCPDCNRVLDGTENGCPALDLPALQEWFKDFDNAVRGPIEEIVAQARELSETWSGMEK